MQNRQAHIENLKKTLDSLDYEIKHLIEERKKEIL